MTPERALLKRLTEWYVGPPDRSSYEQLSALIADARALLAEPEGMPGHDPQCDASTGVGECDCAPTPRSRAEAEAMVINYRDTVAVTCECPCARHFTEEATASAALLAALTGEGT